MVEYVVYFVYFVYSVYSVYFGMVEYSTFCIFCIFCIFWYGGIFYIWCCTTIFPSSFSHHLITSQTSFFFLGVFTIIHRQSPSFITKRQKSLVGHNISSEQTT